ALPLVPPGNAAAADRGRALFQDTTVACASCHVAPLFTNNASMDVGTGGTFQVPSLRGLRWRAPFMHDGCAPTLRDRFGPCGGREAHGHTAALTPAQLDDLVAYMETL
ncbi:MAG: c-type cytochrome, partial [Deltaproteobacteria bacterium]